MKSLLDAGVEEKFGKFINFANHAEFCKPYLLATITDWRTKSLAFASGHLPLQQYAARLLLSEVQDIRAKLGIPVPLPPEPSVEAGLVNDENLFVCGPVASASSAADAETTAESQVMAFLEYPGLASLTENPASRWLEVKDFYPDVYRVYCKYACVQGSTAVAESLFSATGNLHERKRCRWDPVRMARVTFASKNDRELSRINGDD